MSDSAYQRALDYINSYTDYEKTPVPHTAANNDLRRLEELLARLGSPHRQAKSVHVAGTKGKGSVAAMVASVLTASGYTTGLYTSPHLLTLRERIRVKGQLVSETELADLVELIQPEVAAVNRKATYGRLTTFELLTALAFVYFNNRKADFQVLEVGLGGRLDATNVIDPEICIITSISLDHTAILGTTLAAITVEKAGIIKRGSTVVTAPQVAEVNQVLQDVCLNLDARLVKVGSEVTWQSLGFDLENQRLRVKGRLGSYELTIPLLGDFQLENAATAVASLEVLAERGFRISPESITAGLGGVSWPGRFQIIWRRPVIVADGAHNPYSATRLRESLEQYFRPHRAILVIGTSADKDIGGIVSGVAPFFNEVIVTRSRHPRAMAAVPIVTEFRKYGIEASVADDIPTALSLARARTGDGDLVCVTGSLFIVAEAIEEVNKWQVRPV